MFFHNLVTHISSYFKHTGNASKGYKFNEIEQQLNEMADNQENLEDVLDFIKKSNFLEGDEENIFKTIQLLQNVININEQQIQNEQKQPFQYKKQDKISKSKKIIQRKEDILQKNESILNVLLFLENKQIQIQINKSIYNLHLDNLTNDNIDEINSSISDTDTNTNSPKEVQIQQNYFKNIFNSIANSDFNPDDQKNINNSIDNLLINLDANEQRLQQMLIKSIEFEDKKENNQGKINLQINQFLTFFSNNIIELISMLQKKLTIIQITKSVNQLSINISVTDEFPNILSDESEQQEFFDQINTEIITAKTNSKSQQNLSNSVEQLKMAVNINEQRIQKEQQIIEDYKSKKQDQFVRNHSILKTNFSKYNEKINGILGNLELQFEYGQQRKMSAKMIKKFSKNNFDNESQINDEMKAQVDEFNGLKDEIDEIGDMMNFNANENYDVDDDDYDFNGDDS